jgi:hypothetical protein
VERVQFWGNSLGQLRSLSADARAAFAWAILELEQKPSGLPLSAELDLSTERMRGDPGLFRMAVLANKDPPGYRGIYFVERGRVYLIRFRRRDPTTYRGLRKDLNRLLHDLRSA